MCSTDSPPNSKKNDSWETLAGLSQQGNKKAYTQLLSDITPYIKIRISGQLANPDWIDDIVQDILISVHKSLHTYSTDRPFKPWLNAITQFRKTDYLRSHYKKKRTNEALLENTETFEKHVTFQHDVGELKDIEAAMNKLPDKQRKVFVMMKIEGYSAKEVAKEMHMSVSAVKVSAHRTAGKLKELLEQ